MADKEPRQKIKIAYSSIKLMGGGIGIFLIITNYICDVCG